MEDFTIDDCYLPLTATKNKLVCIMFHDDLTESELDQMARAHIGSLRDMGFYDNALLFGYTHTDTTLEIYIKEPVFDLFNHLHSC